MVYSGLEFGLYFEMNGQPGCSNYLMALTPIARMLLCIIQMQFIFLNTTELDLARHKVVARFGLMHMVATNLCEWLHVLVEETKHEIFHLGHHVLQHKSTENQTNPLAGLIMSTTTTTPLASLNGHEALSNGTMEVQPHNVSRRSVNECHRTSIMGTLVQNASPFLFPCTIEYSLICAVILFEMWKQVKTIPNIEKTRRCSLKPHTKSAHHFSVDCSGAHRGMFAGILIIVMTIICLIMYFVLHGAEGYEALAIAEVTICEIVMYALMAVAVLSAMFKMRDLRYQRKNNVGEWQIPIIDCGATGSQLIFFISLTIRSPSCKYSVIGQHTAGTRSKWRLCLRHVQYNGLCCQRPCRGSQRWSHR